MYQQLDSHRAIAVGLCVTMSFLAGACGSTGSTSSSASTTEKATATTAITTSATSATSAKPNQTAATIDDGAATAATGEVVSFTAEVWADNWFALYVNGKLVGEDSVPITTERSFNAEMITFSATYPLTIAIEAKDFKETDSGIEYIGLPNQQMGDGGLVAQIADDSTGKMIAVTSGEWRALVIQRAPLNTGCEKDPDPETTCQFESFETPDQWTEASFDDSGWGTATESSAADIGPKGGYDEITWDPLAALIWGSDLKVDNTVLLRFTTTG